MVYAIGLIGFVAGFGLGLALLSIWLKGRSRRELVTDKNLHYRFGLFTWGLAALCAYVAVRLYQLFFPSV